MARSGSIRGGCQQQTPRRRRQLARSVLVVRSLPAWLLLLLVALLQQVGCQAFVLQRQQVPAATGAAATRANCPSQLALQAVAVGSGDRGTSAPYEQQPSSAVAAGPHQQQPQQEQQLLRRPARARWPQLWGQDLRSPFVSVEVRPATRLEELLAVIDLRAECFAGQQGPLSVEAKLKHVKHVLARRARGAVVLVATARDLLSPFSEEVLVGSLEVSTHEFEARSPFLHDHPSIPKLYLTEVAVKPAFRRQGIAASLLRAVERMAGKVQAQYVCLFCEQGNRGAVRLYEQAGFHAVGTSPSVEAFAAALGLPASKAYGFMYRPTGVVLATLQTQQQQQQQQQQPRATAEDRGQEQEGEEEEEEEQYAIPRLRSGSRVAGQPSLLGPLGQQRDFSWW